MDDTLDVKKWVVLKIKEENKDFEDKIETHKKNQTKLIIKIQGEIDTMKNMVSKGLTEFDDKLLIQEEKLKALRNDFD